MLRISGISKQNCLSKMSKKNPETLQMLFFHQNLGFGSLPSGFEKVTPAKFREKFLTFHLGSFALKFMKSLTNQNFQNVARILIFF